MKSPAIRIQDLSKRYHVSSRRIGYRTIRESFAEFVSAGWRRIRQPRNLPHQSNQRLNGEEFWALRDVSLEIEQGDVVGIIGRNGAGKSTLLKILSRITDPTTGRIELRGRVGSLLEVGTGFHPELTGRENIYMNGSILGMSRREIQAKFDEIVAFSEIEAFLDTPVKRYSSGMYVRLAFAVAAHLEPEILIVDEVLAVGDASFQNKCLGKMKSVSSTGRTILFVSHNLASLRQICKSGVALSDGGVYSVGSIDDTIQAYRKAVAENNLAIVNSSNARLNKPHVLKIECFSACNPEVSDLHTGDDVVIRLYASEYVPHLSCVFTVYDDHDVGVCSFSSRQAITILNSSDPPVLECHLSPLLLLPGRYRINVALFSSNERLSHAEAAMSFEVHESTVDGLPVVGSSYALFHQPHRWRQI